MSEDDENVGRFLQDLIARWNFFLSNQLFCNPIGNSEVIKCVPLQKQLRTLSETILLTSCHNICITGSDIVLFVKPNARRTVLNCVPFSNYRAQLNKNRSKRLAGTFTWLRKMILQPFAHDRSTAHQISMEIGSHCGHYIVCLEKHFAFFICLVSTK